MGASQIVIPNEKEKPKRQKRIARNKIKKTKIEIGEVQKDKNESKKKMVMTL